MSGTLSGGKKAAATNKALYGEDFYKVQGAKGGKVSKKGGFWYKKYVEGNFKFISEQGRKGGTISRRKAKSAV